MDVRVVDFYPSNLEDFVRRTRVKPQHQGLELLSNDGDSVLSFSGDDSGAEETETWEWRFWLRLEDATPDVMPGEPRQSFWALVDNHAGQCLINLDAEDLRSNQDMLERFREHMFILWGNLADIKLAMETQKAGKANRKQGQRKEAPPPHSDDDDDGHGDGHPAPKVSNRPFPCSIEQYGIKMPESDPEKANAGEGRRWQRIFKIYGVRMA